MILCSGVLVAAGREPFKKSNYDVQKSSPPIWPPAKRQGRQHPITSKLIPLTFIPVQSSTAIFNAVYLNICLICDTACQDNLLARLSSAEAFISTVIPAVTYFIMDYSIHALSNLFLYALSFSLALLFCCPDLVKQLFIHPRVAIILKEKRNLAPPNLIPSLYLQNVTL